MLRAEIADRIGIGGAKTFQRHGFEPVLRGKKMRRALVHRR